MAAELQAERLELEQFMADNTIDHSAAMEEMRASVIASGAKAMDELRATVEKLGEGKAHKDEISNLKAFIYDLATIRFNPNGNGDAHGDGVQPYGKWVSNRIESNIGVYGVSTL